MSIAIEFKVYGDTYKGEATPNYSNGRVLWYEVVLNAGYRYTVKKVAGVWKSDFQGIPTEFVLPTGEAIDAALSKS